MSAAGAAGEIRRWCWLGRLGVPEALEIQGRIAAECAAGLRPGTLLLLEHPPTITLGRRAAAEDLLADETGLRRRGIAVVRLGRGGRATYHGPGQLVGYPIVRIGRQVRAWVQGLEEALGAVAASFGVFAGRRIGHPGLWAGDVKLASIGIEVRRGVSRHGFALNVDMDLEPFSAIVPCGVPDLSLTDLSRLCGAKITVGEAASAAVAAFGRHFGEISLENERLHQQDVFRTEDSHEGVQVFLEKRAPEYKGR